MILMALLPGCGGAKPESQAPASKPKFETRWLRGISATEVKTIAQARGLACTGPALEGGISAWTCEANTPLVGYRVKWYGSAPLKLEYITATITQSGAGKTEIVAPLFVALAGLHYDGGDAAQARSWALKAIETPGEATFGPGKFKISGDLTKMTLDMKASGADW